jgi:hypothetical protein
MNNVCSFVHHEDSSIHHIRRRQLWISVLSSITYSTSKIYPFRGWLVWVWSRLDFRDDVRTGVCDTGDTNGSQPVQVEGSRRNGNLRFHHETGVTCPWQSTLQVESTTIFFGFCFYILIVKYRSWLMNYRRNQFRFLRAACLANLKGARPNVPMHHTYIYTSRRWEEGRHGVKGEGWPRWVVCVSYGWRHKNTLSERRCWCDQLCWWHLWLRQFWLWQLWFRLVWLRLIWLRLLVLITTSLIATALITTVFMWSTLLWSGCDCSDSDCSGCYDCSGCDLLWWRLFCCVWIRHDS